MHFECKFRRTIVGSIFGVIILLMLHDIQNGHGFPISFEDFYSQSFIPDALQISYEIRNNISIYYNITALIPFPGKILFNIFVRRLPNDPNEKSENVLIYRNLDFCRTLDMVKNFTLDHYQSDTWLQSTFLTSCPLMRGFYYIANGTVENDVVPLYFSSGKYWMQFELIQVFEEVTKLMNMKAKWSHQTRLVDE